MTLPLCIALHTFNSFSQKYFPLSSRSLVVPRIFGAVWCHLMELDCFMTSKVFPVLSSNLIVFKITFSCPGIHLMYHQMTSLKDQHAGVITQQFSLTHNSSLYYHRRFLVIDSLLDCFTHQQKTERSLWRVKVNERLLLPIIIPVLIHVLSHSLAIIREWSLIAQIKTKQRKKLREL